MIFNKSIDMIRLRIKHNKDFLQDYFSKFNLNPLCNYWCSFKQANFRHNWTFKSETGSFWVGLQHNSENPTNENTFCYVEYNPNKVKGGVLQEIIENVFNTEKLEVISFDYAIDLKADIEQIIIASVLKRDYKLFKTPLGITKYLGKGNGRIKVYDKAKEQKIDKLWTRIEISFEVKREYIGLSLWEPDIELPIFGVYDNNLFLKAELRAMIYAVKEDIIQVNDLTRTNKNKIKELLNNQGQIRLDKQEISQLLNDFVRENIKLKGGI